MIDEVFAFSGPLPQSGTKLPLHEDNGNLAISSSSSWHGWALEKFEQFKHFSEGWDGDQAPRPDRFLLASAGGFVHFLSRHFSGLSAPTISLSENSTVLLMWKHGEQTLDVEFKSSDTVNYFFKDRATDKRQPGTLRHQKFDAFILSQLKEFTDFDVYQYSCNTAR